MLLGGSSVVSFRPAAPISTAVQTNTDTKVTRPACVLLRTNCMSTPCRPSSVQKPALPLWQKTRDCRAEQRLCQEVRCGGVRGGAICTWGQDLPSLSKCDLWHLFSRTWSINERGWRFWWEIALGIKLDRTFRWDTSFVVCLLLGSSPASELYMLTFRSSLSVPSP